MVRRLPEGQDLWSARRGRRLDPARTPPARSWARGEDLVGTATGAWRRWTFDARAARRDREHPGGAAAARAPGVREQVGAQGVAEPGRSAGSRSGRGGDE